jgi:hypothetical protein
METEMKNKKRILILGWIFVLGTFGMAAHIDGQEDMDRFFKAKENVFKREWRDARAGFESYLKNFPEGRMRDEAHFWLAQSLDYLARDEKGRDVIIRLKKAALDEIQTLVDGYPDSLWRDDALAFRIEIAGELVLLGEDGYQKYITEAIKAGSRSSRDLKLQALGSLVNLDPGTALPIIRRVLQTDDDAVVRERCLTLLLLLPASDAEKILGEVACSDRDDKVRSEAASLLEQVRQSRIPVKLGYFIYGSKLLDKSLYSKFPEGKVREFPLDRSPTGDAGAVLDKVKDVFGGKLSTPSSSANGQLPISPYFNRLSRIMNRAGDYRVWIKPSELKVTSERITGEIEFRNRLTNEKFDRTFSVDRTADKLLAARVGDNLTLLMFQFTEQDSTRISEGTAREKSAKTSGSSKEKGYGPLKASSIITLHPGITVRTERMSYDLHSFEKNLIDLEMAKAMIYPGRAPSSLEQQRNVVVKLADVPGSESISREPWALIGDLFYFRDSQRLIGYGAYLINPANEVVAEGLIEVPAGDPAAFKVLSGRTFVKNPRIVTGANEERTRPILTTLWSNHMGWEVLTTQSSMSATQKADKKDFGLARADRAFGGRDWVLVGQIMSLEKERKFIARQAALIASDGTIVHGAEIHVNADDPTDYSVVVKQP